MNKQKERINAIKTITSKVSLGAFCPMNNNAREMQRKRERENEKHN